MKNVRILVIGINYSPELTGIGKYTGETGSWLSARGCSVQAVTAHPYYPEWRTRGGLRSSWYAKDSSDGVDIIRCPVYVPRKPTPFRRVCQDLSFLLSSLCAVTWLLLSRKPFDVVIAVTPSMSASFTGFWYRLWRPKCRFMVRVMDLQAEAAEELGMLRDPRLLRWLVGMETWVLKKAYRVCPLTPAMRDRLVKRGVPWNRTVVFPLWVDFDRIGPGLPDPAAMEKMGLPEQRRIVLYSGAIGEKQGLEVIVDIADSLRGEMPDLLFLVCGNGPYLETLKDLARKRGVENLVFRDLQQDTVFNHLLNRAWLHLVVQKQTRTESYLPSKLMNIMAVGGLVLVTAFPGTTLHSIVHDNEAGMLVTEPRAEPMLRVIRLLSENPSEADRLRANALKYARQNLGRDAVLSEWSERTGLFR